MKDVDKQLLNEVRYGSGYVLRGVQHVDLNWVITGHYQIPLPVPDEHIKDTKIFIPARHVWAIQADPENHAAVTYDAVLMEKEYKLYYVECDTGMEKQVMVNRDMICDWYYSKHISLTPHYYDLMRVPVSLLGCMFEDSVFRSLTWRSFIIRPKTMITMEVLNSDIRYVPKCKRLEDGSLQPLSELEDYVNIDLSLPQYQVSYKSKETGWRTKYESVLRQIIMDDYLQSVQAKMNHMSYEEWIRYKQSCHMVFE